MNMESEKKRCLRCNLDFPNTKEYFLPRRKPKTGLRGICRCCYFNMRHFDPDVPQTREEWIKRLRMLIWRADIKKWNVDDVINDINREFTRHKELLKSFEIKSP